MCTFLPEELNQRYHSVRSTWSMQEASSWLSSRLLTDAGLSHAFTIRPANMSTKVGPDLQAVTERRRELCLALGGDPQRLRGVHQVHGNRVINVASDGSTLDDADAMITRDPGVTLFTLSADCPLIVVLDPASHGWGMAHAGWRGLVAGIVGKLVVALVESYDARPERLLAGISPSAGPKCYEVGADVVNAAAKSWPAAEGLFQCHAGRNCFDLWAAAIAELRRAGLPPDRIDLAGCCTMADERFFSHRRQGTEAGRSALMATYCQR